MLQGPPATGKTSLLQLLYRMASRSGAFGRVMLVTGAVGLEQDLGRFYNTSWPELFASVHTGHAPPCPLLFTHCHNHHNNVFDATGNHLATLDLLLLDEAQMLCSEGHAQFWSDLKLLQQGPSSGLQRPIRVILACMHGDRPSGLAGKPLRACSAMPICCLSADSEVVSMMQMSLAHHGPPLSAPQMSGAQNALSPWSRAIPWRSACS